MKNNTSKDNAARGDGRLRSSYLLADALWFLCVLLAVGLIIGLRWLAVTYWH